MNKMPAKYQFLTAYCIPLLLAVVVKVLIWSPDITPFNADEAIVAIMARHINQGNLPTFFYGQYYMGSLDAILVAGAFRIFGESVAAIRFLQSLLYLGTVLTTVTLGLRILKSYPSALFAGLLAAVPTVNVALYTTVSLGGYGELLLIGNLLLLGGLAIIEDIEKDESILGYSYYLKILIWGVAAGFGFWVIGLSLVYSLPILIVVAWKLRIRKQKNILLTGAALLLGGLVGAAPWWTAGLMQRDLAIFSELFGSAIAGANQGPWIIQLLKRTINLLIFGGTVIAGLRPPWTVRWLMLPLLPFVLIFWMAVLIYSVKRIIKNGSYHLWLLLLMGFILFAGFVLTPYGDDPSGRYFLPLMVPMAIFAADMLTSQGERNKAIQKALISVVVIFNIGGILQSRNTQPPGLTTQFDPVAQVDHAYLDELILFLEKEEISRGYTNYWVSYPLAFQSGEKLIFSPRLPYHKDFRYTARDDRYRAYTDMVRGAEEIAYITTNHSELDHYLRNEFSDMGIAWREKSIGDYTVYYELTEPVHVWDIGLGETTLP